jgi:hypothetical protein
VQTGNFSEQLSNAEQPKNELSLYGEGRVSAECFALNIVKLKQAFPELPNGFYDLLETMLDEEKFTNQRLDDSVKNLIKTCVYPKPTIANILGYDKRAILYTWDELGKISSDYSPEARKRFWSQYVLVQNLNRYVDKIYANYFIKD